tara:strand:+ start:3540 stop:4913 length:1374 start_codon:yes stop_codon:yes gene_type:complete
VKENIMEIPTGLSIVRKPAFAYAILLCILSVWNPVLPQLEAQTESHWIGTWATGLQAQIPAAAKTGQGPTSRPTELFGPVINVNDQTLRQLVRVTSGGSSFRIAFSNVFGSHPLKIGGAGVAIRDNEDNIHSESAVTLTFNNSPTVNVEAGAVVLSDPFELPIPALTDLAIDLYLPSNTSTTRSPISGLRAAWTTNYISDKGNHIGADKFPVADTFNSWLFLARVETLAPQETKVIVALGDSITEGFASTTDTNNRWTDVLAERLVENLGGNAPAVLNVAISGNRILRGNDGSYGVIGTPNATTLNVNAGFGPSALHRFDRDVLLQPGITHLIILESINDIGMAGDNSSPSVDELIAGHRSLIQRAHARGLTVYGGTLTPFEGAMYFTEAGETKRQALNEWIRNSGAYDAIIDFDAILRDSNDPRRLLPMYHPGDWLHPNDAGYQAMGEAIDLTLFQ